MAGIDLGRFRSNKDKNEWVDWLADDPVPASIRGRMRAKAVEEASRPVVRRPGEASATTQPVDHTVKPATVSINISIPHFKFKKPAFKIPPQLLTHKKWLVSGVACLVIVGALGVVFLLNKGDKEEDTPAVLAENSQRADFAYSLPQGSEEGLDAALQYNAEQKVVTYKDSIGGVEIVVNQQKLPPSFGEVTEEKVKKIAEDFSANKAITTANPTSYLGISEEGPQWIVSYKKDLLVLIRSAKAIDEHDWAEYITSLQ